MKTSYLFKIMMPALLLVVLLAGCSKYKYESVPGDPLNVRIYTLDNGLKVYLAVNKDAPRIHTFVGIRVGSKNDPAETTGLSHYFEHLMFKGTSIFGTSDYGAEKPLLDQVEALYEQYRNISDDQQRKAIYAKIDSISQIAAQYAIPNEYDKLMNAIGSRGTNAFTSYDQTAYVENIPSNEVENWAMIQATRFSDPVIRLFHTELETVYEEFNMTLSQDTRKVNDATYSALFPHHPYGTQTIIGSQEHLKNPSIVNLKKHFANYYVPNNMAVCMAGDLNPDEVIQIIDKYLGTLKPGNVPEPKIAQETPITQPIFREVTGIEANSVAITYRLPATDFYQSAIIEMINRMLTNGKAGLMDLNINQQQKALGAGSYTNRLADYNMIQLYGRPKAGQSMDEVRDLMLEQIEKLKNGEFDDDLLEAVINNNKFLQYMQLQNTTNIAFNCLNAFINKDSWKDRVNKLDYQSKLTKADIIDYCKKNFQNNYVVVYKQEGKTDDKKIDKPIITPIPANRDNESEFLAKIKEHSVEPIEPVFLDYEKDLSKFTVKNDIPVVYTKNNTDPIFWLYYLYEMGNNNDKALGTASQYLTYLGTSNRTVEEINKELYKLACSFGVSVDDDEMYIYMYGLTENMEKAMVLLEDRLANALPDKEIYQKRVSDILKSRTDAKLRQQDNFDRLRDYAYWGAKSPLRNILSEKELTNMDPNDLVARIKGLGKYEHKILYYGPLSESQLTDIINRNHAVPETLLPVPPEAVFVEQETKEPTILLANYDAKQIYMAMVHKDGNFDQTIEADRRLYNAYFGGSMNSIVFQEMREARGLAYSANANYRAPVSLDRSYYLSTFIATQTDKMNEAINAFLSILNDMPRSETAFDIAKEYTITNIRTTRILREDILTNYIDSEKLGYTTDPRKAIFEKLPTMNLDNVFAFQQEYVKGQPLTYCILGDLKSLDIKSLEKIGKVKILTQEEIFGY